MATIVFRDWAAMEEHSDKEIIGRLFPDQPAMARMSDGASPSSMGTWTCRPSRLWNLRNPTGTALAEVPPGSHDADRVFSECVTAAFPRARSPFLRPYLRESGCDATRLSSRPRSDKHASRMVPLDCPGDRLDRGRGMAPDVESAGPIQVWISHTWLTGSPSGPHGGRSRRPGSSTSRTSNQAVAARVSLGVTARDIR